MPLVLKGFYTIEIYETSYFLGFLMFACAAASRAMSSLIEVFRTWYPPVRSVGPLGACRNYKSLRITKITLLVFAPNLRVKRFLSDGTFNRDKYFKRKRTFGS